MSYTIKVTSNSKISVPWITFIQSPSTSKGIPLDIYVGSEQLTNGTSYQLNNITVNSTAWNGRAYISDNDLKLTNDANTKCKEPAYLDPDDKNRYQLLEFAGDISKANIDVSYINWYSIPIMLSNGTESRGVPKQGFVHSTLMGKLENLSSNQSKTSIKDGNNTVRIIGPGAKADYLAAYPKLENYINSLFFFYNNNSHISNIPIANNYTGNDAGPDNFRTQDYSNYQIPHQNYIVSYDGSKLTISGTTNIGNEQKAFKMQSQLSIDDFSDAIYLATINYSWELDSLVSNGNTGVNDVFSAISRDLLAGLAYGFAGSADYGAGSSFSWQRVSGTELFSDLQNQLNYYNPWADAFYKNFSRAYSLPFSDFVFNDAPLIDVSDGQTLQVTVLNMD
jgi:hypothetical protein